jgi:hypothetical protein
MSQDEKKLTDQNAEEWWFQVINKDNKTTSWLVSHRWVKEKLGIRTLLDAVAKLENKVSELEKPLRQKKILELLETEQKPRTWRWITNRANVFWPDLSELVQIGQVVEVKHGHIGLYEKRRNPK